MQMFNCKKSQIETYETNIPEYKDTDLDRSKWIIHKFGNDILYNHTANKFMIWDGKRWMYDDTLKIFDLIKKGVKELYKEASGIEDDQVRKRLIDFALKFENLHKLNIA